jgi:hypothetical protein
MRNTFDGAQVSSRRVLLLLFAFVAVFAASVLIPANLGLLPWPFPHAPDYEMSSVEWTPLAGVSGSADATAAARRVLARSEDPEIRRYGLSPSSESTSGFAIALMPHYRPGTHSTGRGVYDSLLETGVRLYRGSPAAVTRSFLLKHVSNGWLYSAYGSGVYWQIDMGDLRKIAAGAVDYRFVHASDALSWYVVRSRTGDFAFPSAHMGMVYAVQPWSTRWISPDPGRYPPDVVYDNIYR